MTVSYSLPLPVFFALRSLAAALCAWNLKWTGSATFWVWSQLSCYQLHATAAVKVLQFHVGLSQFMMNVLDSTLGPWFGYLWKTVKMPSTKAAGQNSDCWAKRFSGLCKTGMLFYQIKSKLRNVTVNKTQRLFYSLKRAFSLFRLDLGWVCRR